MVDPIVVYATANSASLTLLIEHFVDAACASTPYVLFVPGVHQWTGKEATGLSTALDALPLAHRLSMSAIAEHLL